MTEQEMKAAAEPPLDCRVSPLPCPHCGSTDLLGPFCNEYRGDKYAPHWWIECQSCPCGMEVEGVTEQPLLEAWNTRANAEIKGRE